VNVIVCFLNKNPKFSVRLNHGLNFKKRPGLIKCFIPQVKAELLEEDF